jgi:Plasmid stabilization system protein
MPKVIYTKPAINDLQGIWQYLAKEKGNEPAANKLDDAIREKCNVYAQYPNIGRVSETYGVDIRRFSHGKYVVFYKPVHEGIAILHVWHGSQNLPDLISAAQHE